MEELIMPGHLLEKIDKIQLKDFMKMQGFDCDGSKDMLLSRLLNLIKIEDDTDEKEQLIASYHNFLLKTIKHNNNRTVITYPIITTQHSIYFSENNLLSRFEVNSIDNLNHSEIIFGNTLVEKNFTEIFRHIGLKNSRVEIIEICYGRYNKYEREDNTSRTFYEYVWCEINPQQNVFIMTLSDNPREYLKGNVLSSKSKVQKEIENLVRNKYGLISRPYDGKTTLFKIYKYLTAHIEAPYQKKVEPYYDEISTLVSSMKQNLEISDSEDIQLENRIRKLFERNLIQNDFKHFRTKQVDDGRVQSVNYSDDVGGSVRATSGGSFFNGKLNQELDLQDSRVYFDIKESIYSDKELNSITVSWVNKSGLNDDRFSEINVKYTAYQNFYITHFMNYRVREEIYNYVLPKFDEYRGKPL